MRTYAPWRLRKKPSQSESSISSREEEIDDYDGRVGRSLPIKKRRRTQLSPAPDSDYAPRGLRSGTSLTPRRITRQTVMAGADRLMCSDDDGGGDAWKSSGRKQVGQSAGAPPTAPARRGPAKVEECSHASQVRCCHRRMTCSLAGLQLLPTHTREKSAQPLRPVVVAVKPTALTQCEECGLTIESGSLRIGGASRSSPPVQQLQTAPPTPLLPSAVQFVVQ